MILHTYFILSWINKNYKNILNIIEPKNNILFNNTPRVNKILNFKSAVLNHIGPKEN